MVVPEVDRISRWTRMAAIAGVLLAPMAASGAARTSRWLFLGALAQALFASPLPWPRTTWDMALPDGYAQLEGPVLHIPPRVRGGKGHRNANLLHQMRSLACVAYPAPGSPVLSVLPIWHAYERSASYYFLSCACTQTYTTIKQLKKDLPRVQPIAMATVPRLWEAIQAGFEDVLKTFPPSRQRLLRAALANSVAQRQALRQARDLLLEPASMLMRVQAAASTALRWPLHAVASALIWPKLRRQLSGGQLALNGCGDGGLGAFRLPDAVGQCQCYW